jgi:hypothetical protein
MVDSEAYGLLVLVAVVLLAFLSLVREGRACEGSNVGILV